MQAKIAAILPAVSSFSINGKARSTKSTAVTLNNTITGTIPTHYMASESASFSRRGLAALLERPSFTLSGGYGAKTVYFKVKDGSGNESAVVNDSIRGVRLS